MSVFRNIRNSFKTPFKKIKDFLCSDWCKGFLVFLLFVTMASAFWMIRVLNDDYEVKLSIPVRLYNVPKGVIITRNLPAQLIVKIKDRGTALLGYIFNQDFSPVLVNFNDYKDDNSGQVQVLTSELEKNFLTQLSPSTHILSTQPEQMEYIYCKGEYRRVPIQITGTVKAAHQFYLSDTIIQPTYVLAYAPRNILDKLNVAVTQPIFLNDINDKVSQTVAIRSENGVRYYPSSVKVTFQSDILSERTIEVPIQGIRFPSDKRLLTFPSKVNVSFQVGSVKYKQIKPSDFAIEIPYEMLLNYTKEKYPLTLTKIPTEVRNVRISPEKVDFLIEHKKKYVH